MHWMDDRAGGQPQEQLAKHLAPRATLTIAPLILSYRIPNEVGYAADIARENRWETSEVTNRNSLRRNAAPPHPLADAIDCAQLSPQTCGCADANHGRKPRCEGFQRALSHEQNNSWKLTRARDVMRVWPFPDFGLPRALYARVRGAYIKRTGRIKKATPMADDFIPLSTKADLQRLVEQEFEENLKLEYKASPALSRDNAGSDELCKDVSAFANSAGGQIIYGVEEDRKTRKPLKVDEGVTDPKVTREWIMQVLNTRVQAPLRQPWLPGDLGER